MARHKPRFLLAIFLGLAALAAVVLLLPTFTAVGPDGGAPADVTLPASLTPAERAGRAAFVETCAACHGMKAQGTDKGPPLVHPYYRPGHHADGAFWLAVNQGVTQHHWRFGDMPPQPGVSDQEVADITRFVRAVQRANGIE